jgi:hypothetical protein
MDEIFVFAAIVRTVPAKHLSPFLAGKSAQYIRSYKKLARRHS